MDQLAQFALMSKATSVFSNEDTFLSFPITPLVYPKQDLNFSELDVGRVIEFSLISNMIPNGITWDRTRESFLWDIYGTILKEGRFAFSTRTDAEEASYKLARSVLEVKRPDGTFTDSPRLISYHTHQSLYENAVQEYNSQSSTALTLSDEEELKTWTETTEPKLRMEVLLAKDAWENNGYKEMVETARSIIEALGAKSPLLTRTEWQRSFNKDIDTLTRPEDQLMVYPTSIAPLTALDEGSWLPFTLSRQEIAQLIQEAPEELKERYGTTQSTASIESIRFEFSSAKLLRSWFHSEIFNARFWKLDDDRVFSDSGSPPKGEMPYYSIAVVFARNIEVTTSSTGPEPPRSFNGFHILKDLPLLLKEQKVEKVPVSRERLELFKQIRIMPSADLKKKPAVEPSAFLRKDALSTFQPAGSFVLSGIQPAAPEKKDPVKFRGMSVLGHRFDKLNIEALGQVPTKEPEVKPEEKPVLTTETDRENIHILAFICKAIPRSPNPDENLQW